MFQLSASGTTLSNAFVGTGTESIPFAVNVFGGHIVNSIQDQASLGLTYVYAPVPEPEGAWQLVAQVWCCSSRHENGSTEPVEPVSAE